MIAKTEKQNIRHPILYFTLLKIKCFCDDGFSFVFLIIVPVLSLSQSMIHLVFPRSRNWLDAVILLGVSSHRKETTRRNVVTRVLPNKLQPA